MDLCLIGIGGAFIDHVVVQNNNRVRVRELVIGPLEPEYAAILKRLLRRLGDDSCLARAAARPVGRNRAIRLCLGCEEVWVAARPVNPEVFLDPVALRIAGEESRIWVRIGRVPLNDLRAGCW
jgi:hypothetical protein